jgi:hypothetical protein
MHNEEFRKIARAVAAELGDAWSLGDEIGWGFQMNGPGGQRLHIASEKGGRAEIHGVYPSPTAYYFDGEQHRSIGVSLSRGPEAIAREIRRRVMPDYVATLAKVKAADERHREAYEARQEYAGKVYRVIGKEPPALEHWQQRHAEADTRSSVDLSGFAGGNGHVDISFDATKAGIEISGLRSGVVLQILELLAGS